MRQSDILKNEVYAERIKLLYQLSPVAVIMTPLLSGIVTFILWNVVDHKMVIAWMSLVLLISLGRYLFVRKFSVDSLPVDKIVRWDVIFFIGVVMIGLLWGSAGILLSPADSFAHQLFITLILAGLMTGSLGTYAVDMKCFLTYSILSFFPLLIKFLFIGDKIHMAISLVMFLYFITAVVNAKRINMMIVSIFKLQFENKDLITNLASEKERIEKLNAGYEQEIVDRKKAQEEAESLNKMLFGRETKMAELKKEISDLRAQIRDQS